MDQSTMLLGLERAKSILSCNIVMAEDFGRKPLDEDLKSKVRAVLRPVSSTFYPLLHMMDPMLWHEGADMIDLLRYTRCFASTSPHDQLYALLGLSKPWNREATSVNYQAPYEAVLAEFTRWNIRASGRYTHVLFQHIGASIASNLDLPSWVIEPTTSRLNDNTLSQDYGGEGDFASTRPFQAGGPGNMVVSCDTTGMRLSIRSVRVGTLCERTGTLIRPNSWLEYQPWYKSAHAMSETSASQKDDDRQTRQLHDFWATVSAEHRPFVGFAQIDDNNFTKWLPTFHTVMLGKGKHLIDTEISTPDILRLKDYMAEVAEDRAFALLDCGRPALVYDRCQVGDQIVVLKGFHLPFVVRPMQSGNFRLIGDAYVHGIMDGEALGFEDANVTDIVFE
jgi:hypothetical protein